MTLTLLPPISLHKLFIFLPVCICSCCSLRPKYLDSSDPRFPQFNSCPCSLPDAQTPEPPALCDLLLCCWSDLPINQRNVIREVRSLASYLVLYVSSTASQPCDLGDTNHLTGS